MRSLLALMLLASVAHADDVAKAREHYKAASRAYEIGAYDEAIREYGEAYRLKDDPAILYNMAQANRLADHPVEAVRLYRTFLAKMPNAENRAEVENKIETLQKLIDEQHQAKTLKPDSTLPRHEATKPEIKPQTKPEVKPEPKPEAKPVAKPEAKPEPAPIVSTTTEVRREAAPRKKGWVIPVAIVGAVVVVGVAVGLGVGLTSGAKEVDPKPTLMPVSWK